MVAINFKSRFAPDVASLRKRQTIRAPRKNGGDPKPGDMLQLYTGLRTKSARLLAEVSCMEVRKIKISKRGIWIDRKALTWSEAKKMARADGFQDFTDMAQFFHQQHGLPFEGNLILW